MNINQFVINEKILLKKFSNYWNENNKLDNINFPSEISYEEWIEQVYQWYNSK